MLPLDEARLEATSHLVASRDGVSFRIDDECSCFVGYSTWDGRILFVHGYRPAVRRQLVQLAVALDCVRLVWQNHDDALDKEEPQEFLKGWLTLHWSTEALQRYLGPEVPINPQSSIPQALQSSINQFPPHDTFTWRLAQSTDVPHLVRLVHGLAVYEKEPDAVHIEPEQYAVDGFAGASPLFYCLLVQDGDTVVAMAFLYIGYADIKKPYLYLEDLFVEEPHRGKGIGKHTMQILAHATLSLGMEYMAWQALDWNTPALTFYRSIGACVQSGLHTHRYAGRERLQQLL